MEFDFGRYFLVQESEKKYFDFRDEGDFVLEEKIPTDGVSLATIDRLTTVFDGNRDFASYLEHQEEEREGWEIFTTIEYQKKKGELKHLSVVWKDPVLHEIASHAVGGRVDFSNAATSRVFREVYESLMMPSSSIRGMLNRRDSNDVSLNEYNRRWVNVLSNFGENASEILYPGVAESFSSYKEFRALYLAYKRCERSSWERQMQLLQIEKEMDKNEKVLRRTR